MESAGNIFEWSRSHNLYLDRHNISQLGKLLQCVLWIITFQDRLIIMWWHGSMQVCEWLVNL